MGSTAGNSNTTGRQNAFLGFAAGNNNTTGLVNVFIGAYAGFANTTGQQNAFLGQTAGQANTTGSNNVYIGYRSSYNTTTTGYSNVALGIRTAYQNITGHNNVTIGDSAGYNATVSANTFVGSKAGYSNQTGSQNTFVGYQAGKNVTTGSNNIIIGPNAGTTLTDGNDNVLMGYNSQAEDGLHNATAIGAGSRVAISNALILGHQVNVGIGTSAPQSRLEVVSESLNESGLRLTNLTCQSQSTQATDQFLTVNEAGDVIKARYQLRINNAAEWSDKVFSAAYALRPLSSVATYISQYRHLPGVPRLSRLSETAWIWLR